MTLLIRAATHADVDGLVGLMADFYAEAGFRLPSRRATDAFTTLLDDPRLGAVWVAAVDGRLVGHLVLAVAFSMEYGGLRGLIDDLFVVSAFRNRGIGAALLAAARADAVARGLRSLCVETGQSDHPARSLYARAGYMDSEHAFLVHPLATPIHIE